MMTSGLFIPESVEEAEKIVLAVDPDALAGLAKPDFMRVWCAVVYLNPGLHTDNIHDPSYACDPLVRAVLAEVWRRADADEITDEEIYPYEVIRARLAA